jgi:hypothetical protein
LILALLIVAGGIASCSPGLEPGRGRLRAGTGQATPRVTAAADAGQLAIVAVVRNPGDVPLVAGSRRGGDCCQAGSTPDDGAVPRRTARPKFRAGAHETVGVVPATSPGRFRLPSAAPARVTA